MGMDRRRLVTTEYMEGGVFWMDEPNKVILGRCRAFAGK